MLLAQGCPLSQTPTVTRHTHLEYRHLWLVIGYMLITWVVYQTLAASPVSTGFDISDKLIHTVGYFVLMGWFVQIYHGKRQKFYWALFFIGMGIGLEFLQDLTGVRFFEVSDMLANGLGVLLAWALSVTRFSDSLRILEKYISRYRG